MKTTVFSFLIAFVLSAFFFVACDKDEDTGKINIRLTDFPMAVDAVNIDIQEVQFHRSSSSDGADEAGWVTLENMNAGIYNLLDFTAGVDTLLASANVGVGKISQVRLILGENNTIVVDGETKDLEIPSSDVSGLKLNIHAEIVEGVPFTFWLDFDASQSVIVTGSGSYKLQPVIRVLYEKPAGN